MRYIKNIRILMWRIFWWIYRADFIFSESRGWASYLALCPMWWEYNDYRRLRLLWVLWQCDCL